jgi:histidinol-phosphate aminotransferase
VSVLDLARPELRNLKPYVPGDYAPGTLRLNANESPWRAPGDPTDRGLNRYPPPRPEILTELLGRYYDVAQSELLVTRGSSEAIDILIRGFCAAGRDRILICPPTFDMYRVYAEIQGAPIERVPLLVNSSGFALDVDAVLRSLDKGVKLVFLCTPNNPTGGAIPAPEVERICAAAAGRSLVVVDEAYAEYADQPSLRSLRDRFEHVVILRTLSKFVSLAGVRCGAIIAKEPVIDFLSRVLPPYTFPTPSIELVARTLQDAALAVAEERVRIIRSERARLESSLRALPDIETVWPSDANFVFLRAKSGKELVRRARDAGILVRVFDNDPSLANCVRITVGTPDDNDRLLAALA